MKEERVLFVAAGVRLEGLYAAAEGDRGAVVCHPHSLMGGEMGNPVVETLARALFAAGFSTLRFNFRGVGRSTGAFDEGRGEQADVIAAAAFLQERGAGEILPAGYSFGAWVVSGVLGRGGWRPALFAAPPIALFPFDGEALRSRVGLIVCGDCDPYCPKEAVARMAAAIPCPLEVLPGVDHFFGEGLEGLSESAGAFAETLRSRGGPGAPASKRLPEQRGSGPADGGGGGG